jgi:hypothetical protein
MAGNEGKKPEKAPPPPPPPKDEIVAPPFKWVTKGEKGKGVEPGIEVNNKSK